MSNAEPTVLPIEFKPRMVTLEVADFNNEIQVQYTKGLMAGLKLMQDVLVDGMAPEVTPAATNPELLKIVATLADAIKRQVKTEAEDSVVP